MLYMLGVLYIIILPGPPSLLMAKPSADARGRRALSARMYPF